jgi:hypothetical protein
LHSATVANTMAPASSHISPGDPTTQNPYTSHMAERMGLPR